MNTKNIFGIVLCLAFTFFIRAERAVAYVYLDESRCCDTILYFSNHINPSLSCGNPIAGFWFQSRINTAAAAWNNQGTAFILEHYGSTDITCEGGYDINSNWVCKGIKDGYNVVSMDGGCDWGSNSVIAYATWWFWTGGDSAQCIFESDICFNDEVRWYNNTGDCSGKCYDLISVATHEFGHWISGGHEDAIGVLGYKPVMYRYIDSCEMRRNITPDDSALLRWAYDEMGNISLPYRGWYANNYPPYPNPPPHDSCWPPPVFPPDCNSIEYDSCLRICPALDVVWTVIVKDTQGNPVCDFTGTYIDFSECDVTPCPNEEPDWPIVYPYACSLSTGEHYFAVAAGLNSCDFCEPDLYINGAYCDDLYARFFDTDGDLCVTNSDWVGGGVCADYNCNFASESSDSVLWAEHYGHCCSGEYDCEPGNCNGDGVINIFDITYIISYLYLGGPAPIPYEICSADPTCNCVVNIFDITHLISALYLDGIPPGTCKGWLISCGPPLRK